MAAPERAGTGHQTTQGDTLPLFPDRPAWYHSPQTRIERQFVEFHRENPQVYDEVKRRALELYRAGARRVGVALIFEAMRYDHLIRTRGEKFKMNNNYRALYARLLLAELPMLDGVVETRARREKGAQ